MQKLTELEKRQVCYKDTAEFDSNVVEVRGVRQRTSAQAATMHIFVCFTCERVVISLKKPSFSGSIDVERFRFPLAGS